MAEAGEFAVDAPVAPRWVLGRESHDELFSVANRAGSAGAALRVDPSGGGEAAVPGQQRVGRDDESVTDPPRDHTGEPGDHATVDLGELRTCRGS